MAIQPWNLVAQLKGEWSETQRIARNCRGGWLELKSKPTPDSTTIRKVYEDELLVWLQEVIGAPKSISRRWVETPEGFLYSPDVQPVYNKPNIPVTSLPQTGLGTGMWAEVTVPYVDIILESPPNSPWLQGIEHPRLYYSQILWIDEIKTGADGLTYYRVNERYGLDRFWCLAEAFRPLDKAELEPINPGVPDKRVVVDLNHQTLSCMEGKEEVYFCRVSTGSKFNAEGQEVDVWATPPGAHLVWRKAISFHMQGGSTESGWDTLGVPWTTLFVGEGIAIHSTFWHNDFGVPRSHGCVNVPADDAKFVFRWTEPYVGYAPGDLTIEWPNPSTVVEVVQG
ncbi:MAG: L,D-transpeptidase [Anaerolineae bacterium]|nr:L,D-transpeptidase [Anaerolineae bacterium]